MTLLLYVANYKKYVIIQRHRINYP